MTATTGMTDVLFHSTMTRRTGQHRADRDFPQRPQQKTCRRGPEGAPATSRRRQFDRKRVAARTLRIPLCTITASIDAQMGQRTSTSAILTHCQVAQRRLPHGNPGSGPDAPVCPSAHQLTPESPLRITAESPIPSQTSLCAVSRDSVVAQGVTSRGYFHEHAIACRPGGSMTIRCGSAGRQQRGLQPFQQHRHNQCAGTDRVQTRRCASRARTSRRRWTRRSSPVASARRRDVAAEPEIATLPMTRCRARPARSRRSR